MKKILRPRVLIPAILGLALLAALLTVSDIKKVVHVMSNFQHIYLLWFLLLMIIYEVVRGVQWHALLDGLDIHLPLREQIFSFAMGEMTKSLPIGNYFQNYVLQQTGGADFGRTSAATTLIVLMEVGFSLVGVTLIGIGGWSVWLRPLIIGGVALTGLAVWLARKLVHIHAGPSWIIEHKQLRAAWSELKEFSAGARDLLHARAMFSALALGLTYLIIAGSALYLAIRGLGVGIVSYPDALAVYFFSLAVGLIFPLPIDLGVTEVSGVGALLELGVDRNTAIGIMLINRVLTLGASIAIALFVGAILHDELRVALQGQPEEGGRRQEVTSGQKTEKHNDENGVA